MKFKSRINPLFQGLSMMLICLLIFYYFISTPILFLLTFLLTCLLLVTLLREYYKISTILEIHRGLGRIDIDIMQIELLNIAMYGTRPGVEICASDEQQIVVFPVETERFVYALLTINPKIYFQNQQNLNVVRCNL